jgi:DNA-binding GntR family transcriptional regulator
MMALSAPRLHAPEQRPSYAQLAYEALLRGINDRTLEPGQRLELRTIASQLAMSMTPVRDALARLTAEGLTVLDTNKGYRVAPLLTRHQFHQLFAARRVIELGAVAGEATGDQPGDDWLALASEADFDRITNLLAEMRGSAHGPSYAEYSGFSQLDHAFHEAIVRLAGNDVLTGCWRSLRIHLHVHRLYAGEGVVDFTEALAEHQSISDALTSRDSRLLHTATAEHLIKSEIRMEALLPSD